MEIIKAQTVLSVHRIVLPQKCMRIRIALVVLEPRSSQRIIDGMTAIRNQLDTMAEETVGTMNESASTFRLQRIEGHLGITRQFIAIESFIHSTRQKRECKIGTVFYRGILQRFSSCHRTCTSPIVSIIGC